MQYTKEELEKNLQIVKKEIEDAERKGDLSYLKRLKDIKSSIASELSLPNPNKCNRGNGNKWRKRRGK